MKRVRRSSWMKAVMLTLVMALLGSSVMAEAANSPAAKSAKEQVGTALAEVWCYQAKGKLHPPIALSNQRLFIASENGFIATIDADGKSSFVKNLYTSISAPAMGANGDIWIAGKSARLYRYQASGKGDIVGMFSFKNKTENLLPSAVITDGEGRPYFSYEHAVLSLDKQGQKQAALLPVGVKAQHMVPAAKGAYVLGSNGELYAVQGSELIWQASLEQSQQQAQLAADPAGGVAVLAGQQLAVYEADGKLRFTRKLAAAPAGGFTSPIVVDGEVVVAAEKSGNKMMAFRLADGAERWSVSASGAKGFGHAALAPHGESGLVLAGDRSGAVYAIDGAAGSIVYRYAGHAAAPASSVAALDGGRIAYASGDKLIVAGPYKPVTIKYGAAALKLPLGARVMLKDKLKLSAQVEVHFSSDNAKVVQINHKSMVTPVGVGKANITIEVIAPEYKGQLKLPVQISEPNNKLKVKQAVQKVKAAGKTFMVQTVEIPKGMPVTAGIGNRMVGTTQALVDMAKAYRADAAINGTFFSAYGGRPEPYGTIIADGEPVYVGNTGTSVGFTWDGKVMMDTLRTSISGEINGVSNSWYVYSVNNVPEKEETKIVLFTPKFGAKLGFAYGTAVTVRQGVVTKISQNTDAAIPADGYVVLFNNVGDSHVKRFDIGAKVSYTMHTKNSSGEEVDWSRVHTSVGAGPRLVKDGKLSLHAEDEGFRDPKILTSAAGRSGIFVKKDGTVVIATISGATMKQWGEVMIALGAAQGMNLDGGASSGLYTNGKNITTPGRLLSNALMFGNNLKW